jgi:hypothetical protein
MGPVCAESIDSISKRNARFLYIVKDYSKPPIAQGTKPEVQSLESPCIIL